MAGWYNPLVTQSVCTGEGVTALFSKPAQPHSSLWHRLAAEYTIHILVYNANAADQNYLDLANVKPGCYNIRRCTALIGSKCASLDVAGAKVKVHNIEPPVLSAGPSVTACSGGTVSLTATGCTDGIVKWSDGTVGASYTSRSSAT